MPYTIHPLPEIDWGLQIAKRGDQRQMETWQRLGTYTAGLALDDAGIKGDEALCATMDMVVAAGGGERDQIVDAGILAASESRDDRDAAQRETDDGTASDAVSGAAFQSAGRQHLHRSQGDRIFPHLHG